MSKITYTEKVKVITRNNPRNELFGADEANEVKLVVNTNADRTTALEAEQTAQDALIATNASDITAAEADIATNTSNISTNATGIANNVTALAGKEPAITAGTASQFLNGLKSFVSIASEVRASVLTGLSLATGTAITAADNVLSAFGKLQKQISDNITDINTNSSDISTNASNISTNTTDISTNASAISTNSGLIATNVTNIATNTSGLTTANSNISTNASNIATNNADISTNAGNIATNTSNIATNVTNIGTNTANIATNVADIGTLNTAVDGLNTVVDANSIAIGFNDTDIANNAANISTNTTNIGTNTSNIATNVSDIADVSSISGWGSYTDNVYTTGSPLTVTQGNTGIITNSAATLINTYLPTGVSSFYNPATSRITPENLGDSYVVRVNFTARTDNNSGSAVLGFNLGPTPGSDLILQRTITFPRGIGVDRPVTSSNLTFVTSNFLANGMRIELESIVGDTEIFDISFLISRLSKG